MKKYIVSITILLMMFILSCEKSESDCGPEQIGFEPLSGHLLFSKPSEIFWGITGNTRSYTYNWTFANNCTGKNPKVNLIVDLMEANNTLSNPFSFNAGTQTCLAVQAQRAILLTNNQLHYESTEDEIGLGQCFSGQSSVTIYPFITISFTTLGSSLADSQYIVSKVNLINARRIYREPK